MKKNVNEAEFSLTVSRALQLLRLFHEQQLALGLTEISQRLLISKPATSRLLRALENHDFVQQDSNSKKYGVGPEAFRVGNLFAPERRIESYASDLMRALVADTGFTSYLSVLKQDAMVLTFSVEGNGPVRYSIPIGTRLEVHASATGKAALSTLSNAQVLAILKKAGMKQWTSTTIVDHQTLINELSTIRESGYSTNWEELTLGVGSVAAPILSPEKTLQAVISIGFATSQVAKDEMQGLGQKLVELSREISHRLAN